MHQKDRTDNYSIDVRNLTKKSADFTAVDNISFSVKRNETFAFLGPNGAGKTTTIKMLTISSSPNNRNKPRNDLCLENREHVQNLKQFP